MRPLFAALALLLALPAAAEAGEAHGAIALGRSADGNDAAYGFAWNHASRDAAEAAAIRSCSAAGGAVCSVLSWFRNGCGALAMDAHGNARGSSARTVARAEKRALRSCGSGCEIVESLCAEPGQQAETWSGRDHVQQAPQRQAAPAARPRERARVGATPEPLCMDLEGKLERYEERDCWFRTTEGSRCHYWDSVMELGRDWEMRIRWEGACPGGLANGPGTLVVVAETGYGEEVETSSTGSFVRGKRHGRWISSSTHGHSSDVDYHHGSFHGRFVYQTGPDDVTEGAFVSGKAHGWWINRDPDGSCKRTRYEHGTAMEKTGC